MDTTGRQRKIVSFPTKTSDETGDYMLPCSRNVRDKTLIHSRRERLQTEMMRV